ncbi:putative helicase mug81 [Neolecta irregularis DAH-3]|uniref:RNA helicase n=1 Tax=Neolecta irregularis (strain DAH-3) TaxID=1198029 RepID=A0A1U7LHH6_NEOID|nr:putative helicase mug81 [Neolecta irregularis DAH-3]|eukprot:OLL22002.1 putative helicase mug81 [Neolecta irregularis DAH-3]
MTLDDIMESVKGAIVSPNSDDEIQETLLNALGFDQIELLSDIIINRQKLIQLFNTGQDRSLIDQLVSRKDRDAALRQRDHVLLPQGTRIAKTLPHHYEEITVPAAERHHFDNVAMLSLDKLDDLCRGCLKGYTTLNRMQSLVFPTAYGTNENLLICAPTGAGKTDVALFTILRTISQYFKDKPPSDSKNFQIALNEFKIVYVAPMKALAAEIVQKFSKKLEWLGVVVRELTGDMQLTKSEIVKTQIIVTTPEKWDVITRKSTGDVELVNKVRLLIIDEVHLLHDERGAVIESLVARTQRQVEASQLMIRIVGLSATLPNYVDVAEFLKVNPYQGLFYFDQSFRPVPLENHFIGAKGKPGSRKSMDNLNKATFDKMVDLLKGNHQVMIFVHSRGDTARTANILWQMLVDDGQSGLVDCSENPKFDLAKRDLARVKNKDLRELFAHGFSIHHAGMFRSDRNLSERLFMEGTVKILCCTATLAWGVNLPAYAVIIKGTQIYNPQKGAFTDLGVLDVLQIFGRAGRPQFEDRGVGYICTTQDKLAGYVSMLTQQHPIESRFIEKLEDNLNAEIALGTVTNIDEGVRWLSYTYLGVRMRKNPLIYGIGHDEVANDPMLHSRKRDLITTAAKRLHKLQMITFNQTTGDLFAKDLGRTASNFYIRHSSVEIFNTLLQPTMDFAQVLNMISMSSEFDEMKTRDTETQEMFMHYQEIPYPKEKMSFASTPEKVNILLQSYIGRASMELQELVNDTQFVQQNAARICRALFEISLNRNWGPTSLTLLSLCKSIDKRMWDFEHPLAQFGTSKELLQKLERQTKRSVDIDALTFMDATELGQLVHHQKSGQLLARQIRQFPKLSLEITLAPITRNVLRITLVVHPDFEWDNRVHGMSSGFWILAEDSDNIEILHTEFFVLHKRNFHDNHIIEFTIPVNEPLPAQIYIRAVSDKWLSSETVVPVSFQHLILPEMIPAYTDLLDLQPLPISALDNPLLESIYNGKFSHFNPIQTQLFHTVYHTSKNILLGAPTASGKTTVAELAVFWSLQERKGQKIVYVAPMKALVNERVKDWCEKLSKTLGISIVELTGDFTPDTRFLYQADIIVTTPEKIDGISRNWKTRLYIQDVALMIFDEIHLLGSDRGPTLEVIVSRMKYVGAHTGKQPRFVGLSTAAANARDLADWLGVDDGGMFNFRNSVRPVPITVYIDSFSGRAYCPRMETMNKPAFSAIKTHSPTKPVIVFVSSRRQTRLTAVSFIALCGMEENPLRFRSISEDELELVLSQAQDNHLKTSLSFGIGLHHAGLMQGDRRLVEELFLHGKIQVLIATSTLAWGVNLPAHLVIIKGTEFYDAKIGGYKDMDLTDVLQMMGRAGRPQFDTSAVARVFVQHTKKAFYKHFLHTGFPVESSLHKVLDNHLCAEIASGTVQHVQDAMKYLMSTFLHRRVYQNPTFYGIDGTDSKLISTYLSNLVEKSLRNISDSSCIEAIADGSLQITKLGSISSYYYISHFTIRILIGTLKPEMNVQECLSLLCRATEFDEIPVRHNEDLVNAEFSKNVRFPPDELVSLSGFGDPHVKAYLLCQSHLDQLNLPIADYQPDTITVLGSTVRLLQAMIDVTAEFHYLSTAITLIHLLQSLKQGCWNDKLEYSNVLSGISLSTLNQLKSQCSIESFLGLEEVDIRKMLLECDASSKHIHEVITFLSNFPAYRLSLELIENTLQVSCLPVRRFTAPAKAITPKFPKAQTIGWFSILGNKKKNEIYTIKRIGGDSKRYGRDGSLSFKIPLPGDLKDPEASLFLLSDCYLGLDREISLTPDK